MADQTSDNSGVQGVAALPVYIKNLSLPGAGAAGPTQPVSLATLPATENHLGEVGGHSDSIAPTITTTSTAYTSGDGIGGLITLSNIVRVAGGTAILQSLLLVDALNQKPALDILIFNAAPSGGTYTDNAAFAWGSGDMAKLIRKISIATTDWVTIGSKAVADISAISKVLKPASGRDLTMVIVTSGTPTYGADSVSLFMRLGVLQD